MQHAKEIIRQVRKIEISTKQQVDGLIAGNYHSVFKGQGIDFSEIREYRAGDDVRTIDWKVTARFNRPFIKEFVEERDLRVYFAIDVSASGSFGSNISKMQKATEIAASLMFSAMKNNDNVGLFLFTEDVEKHIPARKGRKHVLKLLGTMVSYEPLEKRTDIMKSMESVAKMLKRRSIIFVISDFISDDFSKPLNIMRNRHDIVALRVMDAREQELPDVGLIELEDEETGEQLLVDTSDEEIRTRYAELVREHNESLQKLFRKMKIDMVDLVTDEPYEVALNKFFKTRKIKEIR
ncbi:DUF58 domain-containing protein [uncultured Methanolobus sp.]|uniref:DUF58 domain-containing protein n=1 Tax=uncultured Methanolobus sp. TaxID=218300 RepID=UPI002AABE3E5|nr:DUF58 domain-containing protein [uncultured Methanolobus sp.]